VDAVITENEVLDDICGFDWAELDCAEQSAVAWAYYFFSIQFRENLEIAARLYPSDLLDELVAGECDTDNISPWPDVALPGEKMNHDEFMRRLLDLSPIDPKLQMIIEAAGNRYLRRTRAFPDRTRASSIASYEDGGLERLFTAMLTGQRWDTPLLAAFRHFLERHIGFDSDPTAGHGALARHLPPDDGVEHLWDELRELFIIAVPRLLG